MRVPWVDSNLPSRCSCSILQCYHKHHHSESPAASIALRCPANCCNLQVPIWHQSGFRSVSWLRDPSFPCQHIWSQRGGNDQRWKILLYESIGCRSGTGLKVVRVQTSYFHPINLYCWLLIPIVNNIKICEPFAISYHPIRFFPTYQLSTEETVNFQLPNSPQLLLLFIISGCYNWKTHWL